MTKIAIISQPEQGVLIDVDGCGTLHEATQHLTSTLQVSSEFWDGQDVDLNLGNLVLVPEELAQVIAIMSERGVKPRNVFTKSAVTRKSLESNNIKPASGLPASLQADGTISGGTPQENNLSTAFGAADKIAATNDSAAHNHDNDAPEISDVSVIDEATARSTDTSSESTESDSIDGAAKTATETENGGTEGGTEAGAPPQGASDQPKAPVVPQAPAQPPAPHVLYMRQTLRSGQAISHKGHLVIVGDVNPGAEVMADGDITIWGALRGVAHAGVGGNTNAEIRALRFDPIQLRIAQAIARSPDRPKVSLKTTGPETARIVNGIIRISSSAPE